jgi:lipoprotein-anchoring transpeptidase ErfK/SrfK
VALAAVLGAVPIAASAAVGVGDCPVWVIASPTSRALPFVSFAYRPVATGPRTAVVLGSAPARSGWASAVVEFWQPGSTPHCAVASGPGSRIDAELVRLRSASRYRFRLAARTVRGTAFSGSHTFTTLPVGRIPEGVVVGKVDVGRMRSAAARTVLERAYAKPLRFTFAGAYWRIAPAKAGLRVAFAAAVREALAATPGEIIAAPGLRVSHGTLNGYLAHLARRFGHRRAEAVVRLVGTRAVVNPAASETEVDTVRIADLIRAQLESGDRSLLSLSVKSVPASKQKAVVIRLGAQTLTAYLNGKPMLTTPITTGRSALPTPIGSYAIQYRASPYTFTSPWPAGSPYWYPPTPVTWAMYFYNNDFLHDDPAQPAGSYGAGSENGPYASHGCVHVPHAAMAFLYSWLPIGARVIVAQS